jgi:guanylate kinase
MAQKILGNVSIGKLFILSAPAGTGKTTLVQMLTQEFPCIVDSISFTTRPPRFGELQGQDYCFISEDEFEQRIKEGQFLEYVRLYGNYYGTSREWVESHLNQGKHVILTIDTQGALLLKGRLDATFIFVKPPSLEELLKRLKKRNTESKEVIKERLLWAEHEMEAALHYHYHVVNDDLQVAYQVLRSIIIAEERRQN